MSKNIVICMDGTWNDPTKKTNVFQLFRALVADPELPVDDDAVGRCRSRNGDDLVAFYVEGVGADGRRKDPLAGGLGLGLHQRVLHAFLLASRAYEAGDKFWIFGFSRGAWAARSLAGFIANAGLVPPDRTQGEEALLAADRLWVQAKTQGALKSGRDFWARHDDRPIQLVGVWDTVGALGIPFFNGMRAFDAVEKALFDFADLQLSPRVVHGRHALAIDERRRDFLPTLWQERPDNSIRQAWFAGVHSDVGGGYREPGLSDIALEWMLAEVAALPGAPRFDVPGLRLRPDRAQNRHDEAQGALWKCRPAEPRQIPGSAVLHASVARRFGDRPDYRPESLRAHPGVASYYRTPSPPEDVFDDGESLTAARLAVGEETQVDAFAQNCWNTTGLRVEAGERYEIAAPGRWTDKQYVTTAAGYDSPDLPMRLGEWTRRVEDEPWFRLIACVHEAADLEARNTNAGHVLAGVAESLLRAVPRIDGESQLVGVGANGSIDVDRGGHLYLFANDTPGFYGNNSGYLTVAVRRLA